MDTLFKIFDVQVLSLLGALLLMVALDAKHKAKVARRRKWYHEKKLAGKI